MSRPVHSHDHLYDRTLINARVLHHVLESALVSPIVHQLVELEVEAFGNNLFLHDSSVLFELYQCICLSLDKVVSLSEFLGVLLAAVSHVAASFLRSDEHGENRQELLIAQIIDEAREEEFCEENFVLAGLHRHLTLK